MTQKTFRALVIESKNKQPCAQFKQLKIADLPNEDILVKVSYSSLNYKDALTITGKASICKKVPLIAGIDLSGTIIESKSSDYKEGDKILVNGFGLSEKFNGGYSQYQRINPNWIVKVPVSFNEEEVMAIGTAGYTAMLCIQEIQKHGIKPNKGPILVTGATGGVGSFAIKLLHKLDFNVSAVTGKVEESSKYLKSIGADEILDRKAFHRPSKILESENWSGVIDCTGGSLLATAISQTQREGIVTACGLAAGMILNTTVAPFILRGVTLRGIDSVEAPISKRKKAWEELSRLLTSNELKSIYNTYPMSRVRELATSLLEGNRNGRVVIDVNR